MADHMKRIATVAVAFALFAGLLVPASAGALPSGLGGTSAPVVSATVRDRIAARKATIAARRLAALKKRIENVLRARRARFDAAYANISKRIARVSAIADKVAAAGGDVSGVRAKLSSASAHLASAHDLEAATAAAFRAVPTSGDKKAAFSAARTQGRMAVAQLVKARVDLRDATVALQKVVNQLKTR